MIVYDYTSVQDTSKSSDDFVALLNFWGNTGWKFVCVYNGYIIFEKATKTETVVS